MELRDVQMRLWGPWQSAMWRNAGPGLNCLTVPASMSHTGPGPYDHADERAEFWAEQLRLLLACGLTQSPLSRRQLFAFPEQTRVRIAGPDRTQTFTCGPDGCWQRGNQAKPSPDHATLPVSESTHDNDNLLPDQAQTTVDPTILRNLDLIGQFFLPFQHQPLGAWQYDHPDLRDLLLGKKRKTTRQEKTVSHPRDVVDESWRDWLARGTGTQREIEHRIEATLRAAETLRATDELPPQFAVWQTTWKEYQRWQTEVDKLEGRLHRAKQCQRWAAWQRRWSRMQSERPRADHKQMSLLRAALPQLQALEKRREELTRNHARWEARRKKWQTMAGLPTEDESTAETSEVATEQTSPQELRKLISRANWARTLERGRRRKPSLAGTVTGPAIPLPSTDPALAMPSERLHANAQLVQNARRSEIERELHQAQTILQTLREQRQEALARQASMAHLDNAVAQEPVVLPAAWQRERQQLQQEFEAMRAESQELRQECEQALQPTLMNEWQRMGIAGLFVGGLVAIVFGMFLNIQEPVWPVIGVGFTAIAAGVLLRMSHARIAVPRLTHQRARLHQLQFDMHENRSRWQQLEVAPTSNLTTPLPTPPSDDLLSLASSGQEVAWLDAELEAATTRIDVLRQQLTSLTPDPFLTAAMATLPAVSSFAPEQPHSSTEAIPKPSAAERRALQQWKQRAAQLLRDPEAVTPEYPVRRIAQRLRREFTRWRRQQARQLRARKQYRQAHAQERRWDKELKRCTQRTKSILRRFRCDDLAALIKLQKDTIASARWHKQVQRVARQIQSKLPPGITIATLQAHLENEQHEMGDIDVPALETRLAELREKLQQGLSTLQIDIHRPHPPARNEATLHEIQQQLNVLAEPLKSWLNHGDSLLTQMNSLQPAPLATSTVEEFHQSPTLRLASEWGAKVSDLPHVQLGTTEDLRIVVKWQGSKEPRPLTALTSEQQYPLWFVLRAAVAASLHKKGLACPWMIQDEDLFQRGERQLDLSRVTLLPEISQHMQVIVVSSDSQVTDALRSHGARCVEGQLVPRKSPAPIPAEPTIVPAAVVPVLPEPVETIPTVAPQPPREVLIERETYEVEGPVRTAETPWNAVNWQDHAPPVSVWEVQSGPLHETVDWTEPPQLVYDDDRIWNDTSVDRRSA